MQYQVTLVEQMKVTLTVEANSYEEAIEQANKQFLAHDVDSIEWRRLDTHTRVSLLMDSADENLWRSAVLSVLEPAL